LLADRGRNAAFHEALRRTIVKGESTVADIGAGTGLLGMLAARLGAKRVDLYESAEIAAVARQLLRRNRVGHCRLIMAHSTDVARPARVDIVVSETLGNYPYEENIIETLGDARRRFLAPAGRIVPGSIEQFACPVVGDRFYRELSAWDEVGFGLDFTPAKAFTLNNIYVRTFEPRDLLEGGAAAASWDKVDFTRSNSTTRSGELAFTFDRPATVYGLALWWTAELVAGVGLSTSPLAQRSHWEQLYLPVLSPIAIAPRESLHVGLRSTTSFAAGTNVSWTLRVRTAAGRERLRQALDLAKGYLP
jgi:protein arginine N-methyltransferase 1